MNKGGNYEQLFIGADGIYRREDTSWASPSWGDMTCRNGKEASYTLAPCNAADYSPGSIITNDGIKWIPLTGNVGENFTSQSFNVVAVEEDLANQGTRKSCDLPPYPSGCTNQVTNFVAHYQPGEFTFCTGLTNEEELILLKVLSGPGSGDTFYFMKGWGMVGFEAPGFQAGLMGPGADPSGCTALYPPGDCHLESLNFPPVNIETADSSHPGIAKQPWGDKHDQYPPNQEYVTLCTYDSEIEQTYNAHQNPDTGEIEPYTATEVNQIIETKGKFASEFLRKMAIIFKPVTNFTDKKQIKQSTKSYGNDYISISYKMTTAKQQNQLRNDLILQAKNGLVPDEQIAWSCSSGCFILNCGKPDDSCQPIYLSQDSHLCHQLAYPYLNITPSGSSNSKIIVTDDKGETVHNKVNPNGIISAASDVPSLTIASNQKRALDKTCQTVRKEPTQDTSNPLSFSFRRLISKIIDKLTVVKSTVKIEEQYDPKVKDGILTQITFIKNFIPAKNQGSPNTPDSATADELNLKSLGGGDAQDKLLEFNQSLHPARGYGKPL